MKRSEMVNKICDFMEQDNQQFLWTKQDAAEAFLKFIQECGMLPPPTQKTTLGQWESENEAH